MGIVYILFERATYVFIHKSKFNIHNCYRSKCNKEILIERILEI